MRKLRVPAELADLVRRLHPVVKRKVRAALEDLLDDPGVGKALKDDLEGLRSHRVGRMRIIYRVGLRGTVDLVAIGPRKVIYEETLRLLRKGLE